MGVPMSGFKIPTIMAERWRTRFCCVMCGSYLHEVYAGIQRGQDHHCEERQPRRRHGGCAREKWEIDSFVVK